MSEPRESEQAVAVISGMARGIGAAIGQRFLREGYAVAGVDVREMEWQPDEGGGVEFAKASVADEEAVGKFVEAIVAKYGRVDVLVNVAGVVIVKPLEETEWTEFRQVVDVNLGGTFLLCKHVIPLMKRQCRGAIVNIGSVSGHVGQVDHALYGATKASVIALCRALSWELAPYGIRVNSVSPGSVDTAMLRGDIEIEANRTGRPFDDVKAVREAEQALGRWASPSEIADAAYFLGSAEASFITGTDLLVDGGWVAR